MRFARHRPDPRSACSWSRAAEPADVDADFLPFARPDDRRGDHRRRRRGAALRAGSPPARRCKAFEAALSRAAAAAARCARFASGTATLEVALRVAGVGPGDEVITTPITWVATANVIAAVGARPVFVDVDPRTRNIDLDAVEAAITPRTRALIPVYLAGLPVDMDRAVRARRASTACA